MGLRTGRIWPWALSGLAAAGMACTTDEVVVPPPPPLLASDALTTLFVLTPRAPLDAFSLQAPLTHGTLVDEYGATDETIAKLNAFGVENGFRVNVDSTRTIAMTMLRPEVVEGVFEVDLVYGNIPSLDSTTIGVGAPIEIPFELIGVVDSIVVAAQTSLSTLAYREDIRSTLPSYPSVDVSEEELCQPGLDPKGNGLSAETYRKAFGLDDVDVTGKGRNVAIVELTETINASDFDVFGRCQGIEPLPSIPVVSADVTDQRLGVDSLPVIAEAQMDVQAVLTVAPRLDSIPVAIASSMEDAAGAIGQFPIALAKTLDPAAMGGQLPDAVSVSYSVCEPFLEQKIPGFIDLSERLMAKAFALGVVVVVSAGDAGSSECLPLQEGTFAQAAAYPASSPYALAVGGTNLPINPDGTVNVPALAVWNDWALVQPAGCNGTEPIPCRPRAGAAGGGGPSGRGLIGWAGLDAPPWQVAAGVDVDGRRTTPDLALPAAPQHGLLIYCTAVANGLLASCQSRANAPPEVAWIPGGGTSLAAPLMAAAIALATENAVAAGKDLPFPFARWLYDRAREDQDTYFYDVVNGDNIVGDQTAKFPVDCCDAEPGFDGASGWGMPKISVLIDAAAE